MGKSYLAKTLSVAATVLSFLSPPAWATDGEVYKVDLASSKLVAIDGDTILWPGIGKVRLFGVDAHELGQTCTVDGGEAFDCYGEAKRVLQALLSSGTLWCIKTGTSYDRIVAYCEIDGNDVGGTLVLNGMAFVDTRFTSGLYEKILLLKQAAAWAGQEGAWACKSVEMPWDYRDRMKVRR